MSCLLPFEEVFYMFMTVFHVAVFRYLADKYLYMLMTMFCVAVFRYLTDKYIYIFTTMFCVAVFRYLADKYLEQLNMVVEELPQSTQKIGQGQCVARFAADVIGP